MSIISSANVQIGQSTTATNNITLSSDGAGGLVVQRGVYPALTEVSRFSPTGTIAASKVSIIPSGMGSVTTTVQSELNNRRVNFFRWLT